MPDPVQIQLTPRDVVDLFHRLYYEIGASGRGTWRKTYWMGVPLRKYPTDLFIYQELIHAIRPRFILETGTRNGGSALFLCQMLDLLGCEGQVVTIDIEPPARPIAHPRMTLLSGSSTDPAIVARVNALKGSATPAMVILDSDHSRDHVLAELRAYQGLVTPGSYLIVEDTNVNGHPVCPEHGPGPMEAAEIFVAENSAFEVKRSCEKFLLTTNPCGYLRRRES